MTDEGQISGYCRQTFAILDKWLNQVGQEKGDQALNIVRGAIQNNLDANVTYYEELAKQAEQNGQTELAAKNRLLARLYKGLFKG